MPFRGLLSVVIICVLHCRSVQAMRFKKQSSLKQTSSSNATQLSVQEIADIVSDKARAPLSTILGEVECEEWWLLSLTEVKLPWRIADNARLRLEFHAEAVLQPTGRVLKSGFVKGRNGNPNLHFFFNPATTDKIHIKIIDHWDPIAGAAPRTEWKVELKKSRTGWATGAFEFETKGWWAKSMRGTVLNGDSMAAEEKRLIESGIELTETFEPFFDGPSSLSEWNAYRKHVQKWISYRAGGSKDEEVPGQDMLDAYEDKCFDEDCKLAPVITNRQTRVIGYDYVVRAMKAQGPQIKCNNRFRRNELGSNILNGKFWPEKPSHAIGLGDGRVDHGFARPWLYRLVGTEAANRQSTLQFIKEKAQAFLSPGVFNTNDVLQYATKVNHKLHVFVDISDEDAVHFAGSQMGMLAEIMIPETFAGIGGWIWSNQEFKTKYMTMYRKGLAKGLGEEWTGLSPLKQTKLVSNLLDSLLFAGGLSVPTVAQQAFAVLYGQWGIDQLEKNHGPHWTLTNENVEQFVHEVFRRFPAVGAFPFWDRETNSHTQIDLRAANLQASEAGWGDSAMDFKLRSIKEYESKQISWANMAMVNNDPSHPESHSCPGRQLSINIMLGLFKEFIRTGGTRCWKANLPVDKIKVNAGSSTALTLTLEPGCAA